ncbi:MAG TPA: beta-L-arabinofuranosidase domain-containing protein [Sedimentisphaerales bacterium]|nr:beta-L-arabinofuranosidase domain-containing protein [Sedimentisphaerales bacterium]
MKRQFHGLPVLGVILMCSAALAGDPEYYVKKGTWQETMRASRQALIEFEAKEAGEQAARIKELGLEAGPWYSVGPFGSPNRDPYGVEFGPELETDLEKTYADGTLRWAKRAEWQDGVIHELPGDAPSGEGKVVANYVFRNIAIAKDAKMPVYLGSNDGIQVWFNGERVLARDIGRKAAADQDVVELNFKAGDNKLLIKVNNRAAGHAFYFSMSPGGGLRTGRSEGLWTLLRRDFADRTAQRQMQWEQQDNIWAANLSDDDPVAMAQRYAKALAGFSSLAEQTKKLAESVDTWGDLKSIRELYCYARNSQQLIGDVEQKVDLMTAQFKYLNDKYGSQKKGDAAWQDYEGKLESLTKSSKGALAQAKQGDFAVVEELGKIESSLEELEKTLASQIPQPSRTPKCSAFDLKQVRLLDGPFKRAMERDRKYLHELDSDRLLHTFRVTAGLPSSAAPLGGWEKRELRGHTMGHYLTACALMYSSTGDEKLKAKADTIVAELAKCQKAFGNGYLSAYPEEGIKKVIYSTGGYWAPWYTLHKIFAGLIDMYTHCGNEQALKIAEGMAAWAKGHLDNLSDEQTQQMLKVEFGGMNEVLCNLYAVTKNPDHLALARKFDHKDVFEPLAHFQDKLTGLHANTQIPKITGAAREFEITGEPYYYNIATFFWDQVVDARSYCTGGTSNHEHWRTEPYKLASELSVATQETCCTYNMLKLTRHLFCWNPDARYADYYERALFNSILSTQDPDTGMMMYFVPLASGYWKIFNTPNDSFWCCTGTGLENHAKYGDSIYFHDDKGVFVNLFIASELNWPEKGLTLRQETSFPQESSTTLTFNTKADLEMALRIRVPYWARRGLMVSINGRQQRMRRKPGSYLTLERTWKDGDKVTVEMPMSLHLCPMPDDLTLVAVMYGPLVLAGELGTDGLDPKTQYSENQGVLRNISVPPAPTFVADIQSPEGWIKPVEGRTLTFETVGAGRPANVTLVPYYRLFRQRYAIYWRVRP